MSVDRRCGRFLLAVLACNAEAASFLESSVSSDLRLAGTAQRTGSSIAGISTGMPNSVLGGTPEPGAQPQFLSPEARAVVGATGAQVQVPQTMAPFPQQQAYTIPNGMDLLTAFGSNYQVPNMMFGFGQPQQAQFLEQTLRQYQAALQFAQQKELVAETSAEKAAREAQEQGNRARAQEEQVRAAQKELAKATSELEGVRGHLRQVEDVAEHALAEQKTLEAKLKDAEARESQANHRVEVVEHRSVQELRRAREAIQQAQMQLQEAGIFQARATDESGEEQLGVSAALPGDASASSQPELAQVRSVPATWSSVESDAFVGQPVSSSPQ